MNETAAEISVDLYNLYWYCERNANNFKMFSNAVERYAAARMREG